MDDRAVVAAFLAERWPPADPETLYRWGSTELAALGKPGCLRALLAVEALRPDPADPHDLRALWLAERWVLEPTEAHRKAAARLASAERSWSVPRTIAHAAGRRTLWFDPIGFLLTGVPWHLDPDAFRAKTDAIAQELGAWSAGVGDPVAERHAPRWPLRRAEPGEAERIDRASHASWDSLPEEAFVARERRLRAGRWPRTAHAGWVLGAGLASCEAYRLPCTGGVAFGIASVWVDPAGRGQGRASRMLACLIEELRTEPGAQALVLFSDIGPELYRRLGFVARPAVDRIWPADPGDPDDGPWRGVAESELSALYPSLGAGGGSFRIHPTVEQLDWQLDRARLRAEIGPGRRPARCGARCGEGGILWVEDRQELLILAIDGPDEETIRALMTAAARTAAAIGCQRVRSWDLPIPWPVGTASAPREGGLPMILPLRDSVDPSGWTAIPRGVWL